MDSLWGGVFDKKQAYVSINYNFPSDFTYT